MFRTHFQFENHLRTLWSKKLTLSSGGSDVQGKVCKCMKKGGPCSKKRGGDNPHAYMAQAGNLHGAGSRGAGQPGQCVPV